MASPGGVHPSPHPAPHPAPKPAAGSTAHRRRTLWCAAVLAALAALAAWPAIALFPYAGRAADDQARFHEVAIRTFAAQWPNADLHDYASATTPGYHLLLAAVAKALGAETASRQSLQFAGSLFTLAMAWVLGALALAEIRAARDFARHDRGPLRAERSHASDGLQLDTLRAVVVCLPVLTSLYVWGAGVYLLPDNAGWLGVLIVLGLALARLNAWTTTPQRLLVWWACAAATLALLVFTRQSHVWTAGLLLVSAYLAPAGWPRSVLRDESPRALIVNPARRLLAAAMALSACLPAVLILAYLAVNWNGLVPPRFQAQHADGFNAATPALTLTLLAIYSAFFAGHLLGPLARLWREHRWLIVAAAAVGLLLAAVPVTTYKHEPRASGLWNLVRAMEIRGLVVMGRTSPLLLALAPVGCVALAAWVAMVHSARRWLVLAAFLGFTLAQTANSNAWQRYLEPGLLMFCAIWSAWGWAGRPRSHAVHAVHAVTHHRFGARFDPAFPAQAFRWLGPVALAIALAGVTFFDVRYAQPVATWHERRAWTPPTPEPSPDPTQPGSAPPEPIGTESMGTEPADVEAPAHD